MDRRKRKSQAAIKETLYVLLKKQEFSTIKVSQLCEIADINRGTFYLNYLDKYDLLEKMISEQIDLLASYCSEQRNEEESPLLTTFQYLATKRDQFSLLVSADSYDLFNQHLIKHVLTVLPNYNKTDAIIPIFIANGIVGILKYYLLNESVQIESLYQIEELTKLLEV